LDAEGIYTFVLAGQTIVNATHPVDALVYREDLSPPSSIANFKLSYTHLCIDCGPVDVRLNGKIIFQNIDYTDTSSTVEFPVSDTGAYVLQLFRAGDSFYPIFTLPSLPFKAGGVYCEYGIGLISGPQNVTLSLLSDQEEVYSYFQWRAIHAAPEVGKIDVFFDDGFRYYQVLDDISFNDITDFQTSTLRSTGFLNITVVDDSSGQVVLYSYNPFVANKIYSFAIVGIFANSSTNPLSVWTFEDALDAPSSPDKARVRFVHLAPNTKPLDVYGNDLSLFTSVDYKQAAPYVEVKAHSYRIQLYAAGDTSSPILTDEKIRFDPGNVYTLFATGMPGSVGQIVHKDSHYFYPYLKIAHTSPDAPAVDVWINKKKVFAGVQFTQVADPLPLLLSSNTEEIDLIVMEQGTAGPVLLQGSYNVSADVRYMYAIVGLYAAHTPTPLTGLLIENDWRKPDTRHHVYFRFMHTSPGVPGVDLLINGTTIFDDVTYQGLTDYNLLDEGPAHITIQTNSDNIVLLHFALPLEGGKVYTVFLEGIAGQTLQQVVVQDYRGLNTSFIRVLHASPDIGSVDFLLNGEATFFGVNYTAGSDYQEITRGSYKLAVTEAAQLSPVYLTKNINLPDKKNHTLIFIGQYSATTPRKRQPNNNLDVVMLLDDDTLPDDREELRVRFFHASPDAGALDIYGNDDQLLWQNMQYGSVSDYILLKADDYTLHLRTAGSKDDLKKIQISLPGHTVVTLVAEGYLKKDGAPELTVVQFIDAGIPSPSPSPSSPSPERHRGGLAAWAWALLIVGLIVFVVAAIVAALMIRRRYQGRYGYTTIERT